MHTVRSSQTGRKLLKSAVFLPLVLLAAGCATGPIGGPTAPPADCSPVARLSSTLKAFEEPLKLQNGLQQYEVAYRVICFPPLSDPMCFTLLQLSSGDKILTVKIARLYRNSGGGSRLVYAKQHLVPADRVVTLDWLYSRLQMEQGPAEVPREMSIGLSTQCFFERARGPDRYDCMRRPIIPPDYFDSEREHLRQELPDTDLTALETSQQHYRELLEWFKTESGLGGM